MLNFKRGQREGTANKARSRSIYNGDQSHTLSMNIKIDHDFSPDNIQHKDSKQPYQRSFKNTQKENKSQKFRESLRLMENSHSGKKSHREDIYRRSAKKLGQVRPLETERIFKQNSNISSRKSIIMKTEKSIAITQQTETKCKSSQTITVNYNDIRELMVKMRKMAQENIQLRKQLKFYQQEKSKNSISRALRN